MAKSQPRYKTGPKKGQFKPRARAKTTQKKATRRAAPQAPAKPTYRRNPRRPNVVKTLTNGSITATQILAGKVAVRAAPDLLRLPKTGNAGVAVQIAIAVTLGLVGDMFLKRTTAATLMAGALTVPIENLAYAAQIPYVSTYLSPNAQAEGVSGYVRPGKGIAGYVRPGRGHGTGGYVQRGQTVPPMSTWAGEDHYMYN